MRQPRTDKAHPWRGLALFFLVPIGSLVLFRFESGWYVVGAICVVAVVSMLGIGLWAQSGFDKLDFRDLRLFFRKEGWVDPSKRR